MTIGTHLTIHQNAANGHTARFVGNSDMTPEEARYAINDIRSRLKEAADRILEFQRRNGHTALGFESWEAFLNTKPFEVSTRRIYQLTSWARAQELVTLPMSELTARTLTAVPEQERYTVAKLAESAARLAGDDTLEPKHIRAAADVWTTSTTTGTPDGITPLTAAVSEAVEEAKARQRQHRDDNSPPLYKGDSIDQAIAVLMMASNSHQQVFISIYSKI